MFMHVSISHKWKICNDTHVVCLVHVHDHYGRAYSSLGSVLHNLPLACLVFSTYSPNVILLGSEFICSYCFMILGYSKATDHIPGG